VNTLSTSGVVALFGTVFLASAVEMVEALTIVVAVGLTKGWRSALEGVAVALLALTGLVVVFGPALANVPTASLRIVVGTVLLIFGLQWWRKAILRSIGLKAKHDEDAIFAETVEELQQSPVSTRDAAAFTMAFKGVFLEGIEVVVTVITLGSSANRLGVAAAAALAALVLVALAGLIVTRQLSNVPENAMKMVVGIMAASYGTFWIGEGIGLRWPGKDLALLAFALIYGALTWVIVLSLTPREQSMAVAS
jgi:uncharacterized membrane protein